MEKKSSDARIKANAKYNKNNVKMINLHLNIKTDADILEYLEPMENKTGYIKKLIREDIEKHP